MSSLLDAALAAAARGWPVFPCSPRTKRPLLKETAPGADDGGFHQATTDQEKIRGWWYKWPKAMIGVPTGAPIGAFIVDLDLGDPPLIGGREYLNKFIDHVGGLPHTAIAETASGGIHLYFAWDASRPVGRVIRACPALAIAPDPNSKSAKGGKPKGAGVDLLGLDGYAIVPPSVREDGRGWKWLQELDDGLAPATDCIYEIALKIERDVARDEGQSPAADRASVVPFADSQLRKYALTALEAETRQVAQCPGGQRNDQLNRAAYYLGQLVGAGALQESSVIHALEDAAAACGLTGEDGLKSVRATIRSGLKDGIAKPRPPSSLPHGRPVVPGRSRRHGSPPIQPAPSPSRGTGSSYGGNPDDGNTILHVYQPEPEIVAECASLPLTDVGNGRRLWHHFGDDMLVVRDVGNHVWCGTHWESAGADEAFQRFAQMTAEAIALETEHLDHSAAEIETMQAADGIDGALRKADGRNLNAAEKEKKELLKNADAAAGQLESRRALRQAWVAASAMLPRQRAMVTCVSVHIVVAPSDLDTDPLAINVENGTLHLVKKITREKDLECPDPHATHYIEVTRWHVELRPHNRADRITKLMPVVYDAKATCPRWDAFMTRFQPQEAVRRFLQVFHGYALTGLTDEQAFVFNYGLGANGKTTFIEALVRLMGSYAQMLPAEALTGDLQRRGDQATPEFARLGGARFVHCAELPRGQGLRENVIKLFTGGEKLLVRHLHCRFFELEPRFKAVGIGNDRPNIGGVDEGIWRRVKLVPWEVAIAKREQRRMAAVLAEFAAEAPGILNWLLAGLVEYLEDGLVVPPEIQAATETYRADMDPVGEFLRACVERSEDDTVTARDMFRAYVAWCHANSVKPFSERAFAGIMTQKAFKKRPGRIKLYLDVRLVGVPDDPDLPV